MKKLATMELAILWVHTVVNQMVLTTKNFIFTKDSSLHRCIQASIQGSILAMTVESNLASFRVKTVFF
jgi:hypothetical protein